RADDEGHHETIGGNHDPARSPHRHPPHPRCDPVRADARAVGARGRDRLARAAPRGRRGRASDRRTGMTFEMIAVVLVTIVPALLFLGWLALMATVVAALGATSDIDIDEVTFCGRRRACPDPADRARDVRSASEAGPHGGRGRL